MALCKLEPVDFLGGRADYLFVSPKAQPALSSAVALLIFFIIIIFEGCVCDFIRKVSAWHFSGTALRGLGSSSRARL